MADAKKCDRCGCLYEIYDGIQFVKNGIHYNWIKVSTTSGFNSKIYELCPKCMTELIVFLNLEAKSDVKDV